ncbi:MAG TPA: mercury(II) reductase [Gammaproteobacteria bacterium]|nr:mercury(II) reductase [Gammaproteobacteria bacterium]
MSCCEPRIADRPASAAGDPVHVAIVGSGSGAFAAAIEAAARGARVTLIEASDVIGGTCVNVGCVPSKILIRGAQIAWQQQHHNFEGVARHAAAIDRRTMVRQQQELVERLRVSKYLEVLKSTPGLSLMKGRAHFADRSTLVVRDSEGHEQRVHADRILLAVGARPAIPAIEGLTDTPYWTSTEALVAEELPRHLVVLGGSVVALELAQAFLHLGSKVTLLARSTLLSREDADIGAALKTILEAEGMEIRLHTVPERVTHDGEHFHVHTGSGDLLCDRLLVATGRRSNGDRLKLENAGIAATPEGDILVDDHMRTSAEQVYAAGDCTNQPQYVYVAAAAGTRAARTMLGEETALDLSAMSAVVFTDPQVATVGLSEKQARDQGMDCESRTLALEYVPRAIANMDTRGFIKLVADRNDGRLLGCQAVAHEAGELIQTAALAIHEEMNVDELAAQLFPYLTMVEGLKLCAQTFRKDVSQLSCCAG